MKEKVTVNEDPPNPDFSFDTAVEEGKIDDPKEVITIFGQKGVGKTATALGIPGSMYVLSFDDKSSRVKNNMYPSRKDITVLNAVKYLTHEKTKYLDSSKKTYDYVVFLLEKIIENGGSDWIVFDGEEILVKICEMTMRFDNGLAPFQGIANFSLWNYRNLMVSALHDIAVRASKRGIIYTTYIEKDELVESGQIIRKKDAPKWVDTVMHKTDHVLKVENSFEEGKGQRILVTVVTAKTNRFETGTRFDITGTTLAKAVDWDKKIAKERSKRADVLASELLS